MIDRKPFIIRKPITGIFGYVYLTTCLINDKKYIGQHKHNRIQWIAATLVVGL
jgi:hypothetical protein